MVEGLRVATKECEVDTRASGTQQVVRVGRPEERLQSLQCVVVESHRFFPSAKPPQRPADLYREFECLPVIAAKCFPPVAESGVSQFYGLAVVAFAVEAADLIDDQSPHGVI